jgi:hypothetical protein
MVNTGSPVWAEKKYRILVYVMFLVSASMLTFFTYRKHIQDKALDDKLDKAYKASMVATPAFVGLLGVMMFNSVSKDDITASMQPHIKKISNGMSGLRSVT